MVRNFDTLVERFDNLSGLKVKLLSDTAKLPTKAHDSDAGYDLYLDEQKLLYPGEFARITTNIAIQFSGTAYNAGVIRARSSAFAKGLMIQGLIDQDYSGTVFVQVWNVSRDVLRLEKGDRIAQLILLHAGSPEVLEVSELTATVRGNKGFGSSGK